MLILNHTWCRTSVKSLGFSSNGYVAYCICHIMKSMPHPSALHLPRLLVGPASDSWQSCTMNSIAQNPCIVKHAEALVGMDKCLILVGFSWLFERSQCSLICLLLHFGYARAYDSTSSGWTWCSTSASLPDWDWLFMQPVSLRHFTKDRLVGWVVFNGTRSKKGHANKDRMIW